MDSPVFQAKNLGYAYNGGITALAGVNLEIAAGEKVAILGANGSGKSTLLKLLDGLFYPSSGELWAFGRLLTQESMADAEYVLAFRSRVGLVFQDPDVQLFCPTVWDEVAFGPLQLGLSQQDVRNRVGDTLALLEIERLAQRPPYHLSGGEKKKVALASVLSLDLEVLLLDEPTASLDPRSQAHLVDLIGELHQAGKTIVTATQDLDIVEEIADRAYILNEKNELAAEGGVAEILASREILLDANLVHEHVHRHDGTTHAHPHRHLTFHEHEHKGQTVERK
ncbi:MAG: ABC transporter ATP-binding protein [Chloroflexota bacterium]